ncbi:WhiB family transcriptional regulator [Streptomyces parvulus]|uniref:WhiB family transcriptional regulator n=1 Tax=Streptomyces parvulus TaxID=146923 RepID=UPI0033A6A74B
MAYTGSIPDTVARPRDWMTQMACRAEDPALFFDSSREHEARLVCITRCPVRAQCLANVKAAEEGAHCDDRDGVVAGLTGTERWRLDADATRRQGEPPPLALQGPEPCGTYTAMLRHLWLNERMDGICWSGEVRRDYANRHWPKRSRRKGARRGDPEGPTGQS